MNAYVRWCRWHKTLALGSAIWASLMLTTAAVAATEAAWIWGSEQAQVQAPAGRCDFRLRFVLQAPAAGTLRITCDNRYIVRLNGHLVGLGRDWQAWSAYQVDPFLVAGDNEILVRCVNDEAGPAGLAVQLTVTDQHGQTQEIVTNDQWEARLQQDGTWDPAIESRTPWARVSVLGPVGSTAPWGDQIQPAVTIQAVHTRSTRDAGDFTLRDGDRVAWLGGTLIEREQRYGYWEAMLATSFPAAHVVQRNLGWSGDTVWGEARARFGTAHEGFEHLETHLFAEAPTVIFVAYGGNEAFAGAEELARFIEGYEHLLDVLAATGAEIVLVTPAPLEALGAPLPDPTAQNATLQQYVDAITNLAEQRQYRLVNLFRDLPTTARELGIQGPLTDNGIHLSDAGYWCAAHVIRAALGIHDPPRQWTLDLEQKSATATRGTLEELAEQSGRWRFRCRDVALEIPPPFAQVRPNGSTLRIAHLPAGEFELKVNGAPVARASSDQWSTGVAIGQLTAAPAAELLDTVKRKNELYFHRWRPQNETYLFLFRKHEQGNNAVEIPQFDPLIEQGESQVFLRQQPVTLEAELVPVAP